MVPWFEGHSSFPASIALDLSTMSFGHSTCHTFNSLMFLVRHVTLFGLWYLLKHVLFFPQIVISWYDFSSFPFSGTHYVLRHNVFRATNLTGHLYLVCKICWIHLRHISTVCEPSAGCEFFNNIGTKKGEVAWWRHPFLVVFSHQKNCLFCPTDSHWMIEWVMIIQSTTTDGPAYCNFSTKCKQLIVFPIHSHLLDIR